MRISEVSRLNWCFEPSQPNKWRNQAGQKEGGMNDGKKRDRKTKRYEGTEEKNNNIETMYKRDT